MSSRKDHSDYMRTGHMPANEHIKEILEETSEETGISKSYIRDAYNAVFNYFDDEVKGRTYPHLHLTNLITFKPKYNKMYRYLMQIRLQEWQGDYKLAKYNEQLKKELMPMMYRWATMNRKKYYKDVCNDIIKFKNFEDIFDKCLYQMAQRGSIPKYSEWYADLEKRVFDRNLCVRPGQEG